MILLNGVSANGDSSIVGVSKGDRSNYRTFKVNITGTATVTLYGRMDPNDSVWGQIAQFTASGLVGVLLTPQIKVTVSSASSATVYAWVDFLS